jgi:hypothetical protein
MQKTAIQILSIHDRRDACLAFDLKDVLRALGRHLEQWIWCITELDCIGSRTEAVTQQVKAARGRGVWMHSAEMMKLAGDMDQTIDGEIIAFPKDIDRHSIEARELNVSAFPGSRAELAIRAVDSSFFEVYTKDPEIAHLLRRQFKDIHSEDPTRYFSDACSPE